MSSEKSSKMRKSAHTAILRRSGRVRRSVVVAGYDSDSLNIEVQVSRKHPIGRCSSKKPKCLAVEQEQQLQEPPSVTDGNTPFVCFFRKAFFSIIKF